MWLALVTAALAVTDFTGVWKLDLRASSSLDAILEAEGASWAERQAAATLTTTQHITQDAHAMTIVIASSLIDRKDTLVLDGAPQAGTTKNGAPTVARTRWDGDAVLTTLVTTLPEGATTMTIRRTLEDGGATMRQHIRLVKPDGTTYDVDRVFRRAP